MCFINRSYQKTARNFPVSCGLPPGTCGANPLPEQPVVVMSHFLYPSLGTMITMGCQWRTPKSPEFIYHWKHHHGSQRKIGCTPMAFSWHVMAEILSLRLHPMPLSASSIWESHLSGAGFAIPIISCWNLGKKQQKNGTFLFGELKPRLRWNHKTKTLDNDFNRAHGYNWMV